MASYRLGLVLLWACGCATPTAVVPSPTPPPPAAPVPVASVAPKPAPAAIPKAGIGDYQAALFRSLAQRLRAPRMETVEAVAPPPEFHTVVFKKLGRKKSFILATNGLGFVERPAPKAADRRIEFIAYSARTSPKIAHVLEGLARRLHDPLTAHEFEPYASVALDEPVHELRYFDLLPGGEYDLDDGRRIVFLKVVPIGPDEFEARQKSETQFAGQDDAEPGGRDAALLRWAPAIDASEASAP